MPGLGQFKVKINALDNLGRHHILKILSNLVLYH